MCNTIDILGGAFSTTFEKGKDGKKRWIYKANVDQIGKRPPYKGSEKEKPQYSFIAIAEKEAVKSHQKFLTTLTIDIVKFLKQV